MQDGGWVGEVPSGNRNGHTGREGQVHSPKSIPSDTLPRATESRMAPRPFSQAWGGKARTQTHHQGAVPPLAPLCPDSPCPPVPTSWYFSRATLVSAPSWVSMKSSLFLWMFSRMPFREDKGRSGCGRWTVGSRMGVSCLNSALPLTPGRQATLSPGFSLPSGDRGRVVAGSCLTSLENPVIPGGNQSPSSGQVGQAGGPGDQSGCSTPSL